MTGSRLKAGYLMYRGKRNLIYTRNFPQSPVLIFSVNTLIVGLAGIATNQLPRLKVVFVVTKVFSAKMKFARATEFQLSSNFKLSL